MNSKYIVAIIASALTGVGIGTQIRPQHQQAFAADTPEVTPSVSRAKRVPVAMQADTATEKGIAITVPAGARQRFGGFGTSIGNWGGNYQKLPADTRARLSRMLWHDLKFNTLRLWFNTDQYAPTAGAHDMTEFRRQYIDSGVIADARKQGVTTLLLGPEHLPEYMKDSPYAVE